jgi:isopentenyldiphosphate isomerase
MKSEHRIMYTPYKMKRDGSERNYIRCGGAFDTHEKALDAAQSIYENDPSYKVEVRTIKMVITEAEMLDSIKWVTTDELQQIVEAAELVFTRWINTEKELEDGK